MIRRTLFLLALAVVMGLQPPAVAAHSELVAAVPAPGAALTTAPAEIRLTFSEPLAAGSTFLLLGENFQQVPGITAMINPESAEELVAAVPALALGAYTVHWTSVAADGDTLRGSYSFTLLAETQNDSRALIWSVAAAAGLTLAAGLAWLYRRRRTPGGEKTRERTE